MDKILQSEKSKILEKTVLVGNVEKISEIMEQLAPIENTARALGLACRFGGLYCVKALVEHGASFRYVRPEGESGYYFINYPLALLEIDEVLRLATFLDTYDDCFNDIIHAYDERKYPVTLHTLPIEHRAEIVKYLCGHSEQVFFDAGELLYYSIMSGTKPIAEALRNLGAKFSENRIEALTVTNVDTFVRRGYEWNEFCYMSNQLKDDNFIEVMENIREEVRHKTFRYTNSFFYGKDSLYKPDIFKFIIDNFDRKKMNKTQFMKGAIDHNSVECLEECIKYGWLKLPKKRDEMINYAADNNKTECTAFLLDFKNRTADLAAERAKADKKMERELNADPNSASELKKIWGFEPFPDDENSVIITRYKGDRSGKSSKEIRVPERIGKNIVTAIGEYALSPGASRILTMQVMFRRTITKVILPDSIRVIGNGAFADCWEMSELKIPPNVAEIGERAFFGCRNVSEFTVPKTVKTIGNSAFASCESFASIELPEGITEIGEYTFGNCSNLRYVSIPASVEKIGRWAFIRCKALEEVIVPEGVVEIDENVFSNCPKLKTVTLPRSVKKIKNRTDSGHKPQTIFFESENVTVIVPEGSYAEKYCKKNEIPYIYTEEERA